METEFVNSCLSSWINAYSNQHPDPVTLQRIAESIVSEYEEKEKHQLYEHQQTIKKRITPDKDGFITVTRINSSKKRPFYHSSIISEKKKELKSAPLFYKPISKMENSSCKLYTLLQYDYNII